MPRSCSPARKRQRLSSPTYDDQVGDLTQEDLAAFDAIEAQLSQDVPRPTFKKPKEAGEQEPSSSYPGFAFVSTKASNLRDDPDNPFSNGFASAATLPTSTIPPAPIAFASASKVLLAQNHDATHATPVFQVAKFSTGSALAGFTKASNKGVIMPSKEALAKAKAKLDAWQKEEDAKLRGTEHENHENFPAPAPDISSGFKLASSSLLAQSPMRVAFQPVSNIVDTPATPSPAGFSRPSLPVSAEAHPSPNNNAYRPKQFKPPMLKQLNASNNGSMAGSPLNSNRPTASLGFTSAASQHPHPLAAPPISAVSIAPQHESSGSSAFTTPLRTKINTTISRTTPIPFKTPFKPGMGPSEPGRLSLGASGNGRTPQYTKSATPVRENWLTRERPPWNPPSRKQFFCLTSPTERVTLASSGLRPQQYEADELETMGMPAEALKELLDRGCVLATKPWVDNHWCLVLWKLAGMVALDPEKEMKPDTARWCWAEVIRQLLYRYIYFLLLSIMKTSIDATVPIYRYERELNSGLRPPLRKIANQDAPAAFPMVLCVSNVLWSPAG
ncbi:hypothetical protein BDZ97DRAFT_1913615 [Flammula alnicola]|nr:hypothetical protein BDZ97DRAFT_1913615 [Flammula alnicola]